MHIARSINTASAISCQHWSNVRCADCSQVQSIHFPDGKHSDATSNAVSGHLCFACRLHVSDAMMTQTRRKRTTNTHTQALFISRAGLWLPGQLAMTTRFQHWANGTPELH